MEATQPGGALSEKFRAPTAEEAAATPGFQFQFDQGNKALQRAASAAGGLMSGGTLKAAAQYGQGLASTYYQNAFNNSANVFNLNRTATLSSLMALTDVGKFGTSQYNSASENFGNRTAGNLSHMGDQELQTNEFNAQLGQRGNEASVGALMQGAGARAAGTVGSTNALTNMIGGLGYAGAGIASAAQGIRNPIQNPNSAGAAYRNNPLYTTSGGTRWGAGPDLDPNNLPPGYGRPVSHFMTAGEYDPSYSVRG